MNKRRVDQVPFLVYVYQAILVIASAFILAREGEALVDSLLSEPPAILGILLISAIIVEARPVRWTATQNTTLVPIVLLLTLILVKDPVLVVVVSGIGALVGYGLLRELRLNLQTSSRALMRVLFYTTQAVAASGITAGLHSLLPGSTQTAFMLDAVIGFGLVVVYILCSRGLVSVYNRLASLRWAGDAPLPAPRLLLFFLMASAPLITMWFYRIVPEGRYFLVELVGQDAVRALIILCVWPIALLFVYVVSPYLTIGLESEEVKKDYAQFSRYSEKMLDMAGVTKLIARDMQLEFGCDDCIIYSWNDKKRTYELEGGLVGGQPERCTSAQAIPDIDWPQAVDPQNNALGRAVERGQLGSFQGEDARDFLKDVGLSFTQYTSLLIVPLHYVREVSSDTVRVGSVVLLKRVGTFGYSQRIQAARLLDRPTPVHIGLRQARLYRDAQQFFNDINEAVSKSGDALAATQALFSKGIDPAVFVTGVRRGVHTRSLRNVVKNISEGRSPDEGIDLLDDEGMEELYERLKRDDSNLPEMTDEIRGHLHTFVSSLSVSFAMPFRWPRPEYSRITSEMQDLYRILLSALEANSIDEILAFDARLSAQARLERLRADFPEAVRELSGLQEMVETLRLSQADGVDDETRVDRLSEALRMLDRADGDGRGSPEQAVIAQIRGLWASVLHNTKEELLGQSDITMQLETRTAILSAEGIVVSLRVGNRGRSAAIGVVVRLAPSEWYDIRDEGEPGISRVERLEPGHSHVLSFGILPKREDFVRVAFKAVWSDRVRADHGASYADRVVLRPESSVFIPIDNPYVPGPPLRLGSRLFVGREDVFEFVRDNIGTRGQHNVLMLTGQRRTGKTSLALHLPKYLDRDRYVVAYVDCQALGTEPGMSVFLRDLTWMICDGLEEYGIECEPVSFEETGPTATERFLREFLPEVFGSIGERSLVLVLDEFEGLEKLVEERKVDDTVFGLLRHLMQHTPDLAFVLVGTHRLQELSQDYWSILFSIAIQNRIGFLDEQSARRLITALPQQDIFDSLAVEEILQFTAGHPYLIQFLCYYLVDFRNRTQSQIVTAQHVRDAIGEILVQAEGYFVNLWQMATGEQRMIMASASRVLARQVTVQTGELVEQLAAYEVYLDIDDIRSCEAALVAREIFWRLDGDPPRYRFKVELFRRWIDRNQPLSLVVGSWT